MVENVRNEELIAKYKSKFKQANLSSNGGIFTKKARAQLLGMSRKRKDKTSENDFWHDRRENIKNAIIDLELFIETGGDKVNQVITLQTMKPVFDRYFVDPFKDGTTRIDDLTGIEMGDWIEKPLLHKAVMARYLIRICFNYLGNFQGNSITEANERTMREAYDLAKYLVEMFKPLSERNYKREVKPL